MSASVTPMAKPYSILPVIIQLIKKVLKDATTLHVMVFAMCLRLKTVAIVLSSQKGMTIPIAADRLTIPDTVY